MIGTGKGSGNNKPCIDLHRLHEQNFKLLMRLAPQLRKVDGPLVSKNEVGNEIHLSVLENSPYTLTLSMTEFLETGSLKISYPDIQLRVYYDARVAEVLRFRTRTGLAWLVPDQRFRQLGRGHMIRLNNFLRNWLTRCIAQGHHFKLAPMNDAILVVPDPYLR